MINTNDIRKIIRLCLNSSNIKNSKILSLIIVAGAGKGKTELITSFQAPQIVKMTDISYFGMLNLIKENSELKHVIIPDFIKITEKKGATSRNFISFLNSFLEDGIFKINLYNNSQDFKGMKGGIITATTKSSFIKKYKEWEGNGFLSRMLLLTYDYSKKTTKEIINFIAEEKKFVGKVEKIKIYKNPKEIKSSFKMNKLLAEYSKGNFRKQKQLQALAKTNAFLEGRKEVNIEDIKEIIRLSKRFLNMEYNKI